MSMQKDGKIKMESQDIHQHALMNGKQEYVTNRK